MDHAKAELRSLRYHSVIAERIPTEPAIVARALSRTQAWLQDRSVAEYYAAGWRDLLSGSVQTLCAFLVDPSEKARAFRQVSPFAGVLSPRERWQLWAEADIEHDATAA